MQYDKYDVITFFSLLITIIVASRWIYQYINLSLSTYFQSLILVILIISIFIFRLLNKNKLRDYAKKHGVIIKSYNKNQYAISVNRLNTIPNLQSTDENILQLASQLVGSQLMFSLTIMPKNGNSEIFLIIFKPVINNSDIDSFVDQLSGIKAAFHAYLGYIAVNETERLIKNELPIPI